MSISLDEVNKIAKLARLSFNEEEKQKLQHELSWILDYVDQLKQLQDKVSVQSFDDPDAVNLMRDDLAIDKDPEVFLEQAGPSRREGKFVKVKSVLE